MERKAARAAAAREAPEKRGTARRKAEPQMAAMAPPQPFSDSEVAEAMARVAMREALANGGGDAMGENLGQRPIPEPNPSVDSSDDQESPGPDRYEATNFSACSGLSAAATGGCGQAADALSTAAAHATEEERTYVSKAAVAAGSLWGRVAALRGERDRDDKALVPIPRKSQPYLTHY